MKIETFDLLEFENANSHEKQIYAKKIDEQLQKIGFWFLIFWRKRKMMKSKVTAQWNFLILYHLI